MGMVSETSWRFGMGIERLNVNELRGNVRTKRSIKWRTKQAEPSRKKRRNMLLVSLHRIRDILGRALFIRSSVSSQFRMSGICDPCRRGYIRFVLLEQKVLSTAQLLHSSAPGFSYYPDQGTTISKLRSWRLHQHYSSHCPTQSRPCKAVPPSRNMA